MEQFSCEIMKPSTDVMAVGKIMVISFEIILGTCVNRS